MGSRKIFSRTKRKSLGKTAENEERRQETTTPVTNGADGQFERGSENATDPVAQPESTAERTTEPNLGPSHDQVVSEAADAEPQTNNPTSPKSESKIKSWFKGKLSRRSSKPPPPEEPTRQEGEAVATGGVSAAEASLRAAPLTSHPVRDADLVSDLAPQRRPEEDTFNEEVSRQWSSSTEESNRRWSSSPAGEDGHRRKKGLRMSLRDMIARRSTSDTGSAAGSPLASPTTSAPAPAPAGGGSKTVGTAAMSSRPPEVPRLNTMERNELHDSFTEESLPPPPSLVQAERRSLSGSARDSKFSEDL